MKVKLLLRFADWLEQNIKPEQFDFTTVIKGLHKNDKREPQPDCGTIGCAIGWLPMFHKSRQSKMLLEYRSRFDSPPYNDAYPLVLEGEPTDYVHVASVYFSMSIEDAYNLFTPNEQYNFDDWDREVLKGNSTPKEVADGIRYYVQIKTGVCES